jgi:hypothetical protein
MNDSTPMAYRRIFSSYLIGLSGKLQACVPIHGREGFGVKYACAAGKHAGSREPFYHSACPHDRAAGAGKRSGPVLAAR